MYALQLYIRIHSSSSNPGPARPSMVLLSTATSSGFQSLLHVRRSIRVSEALSRIAGASAFVLSEPRLLSLRLIDVSEVLMRIASAIAVIPSDV